MAWLTPKTDWSGADGVRNTDLNRIEGNILDLNSRSVNTDANIASLRQYVDNRLFELSNLAPVGELAIGAEIGIYENGILTPFIKIVNDYTVTGRSLVIRKDCVTTGPLREPSDTYYNGSRVDDWLNSIYASYLESEVQDAVTAVSIQTTGLSGLAISRRFFLLSLTEQGLTMAGMPIEGTALNYFSSNARRVAYFNGSPTGYWTRTINNASTAAAYISVSGSPYSGDPNNLQIGIRPAFTLPDDFEVVAGVPVAANVLAVAEVIE